MIKQSTVAGEHVGALLGNTVTGVNTIAKASVIAALCFVGGVKTGWLRATTVAPQERKAAETRLIRGCCIKVIP
jgi:hypothetical protein